METEENDKLILDNMNLAYKVALIYYRKLNGFIELEDLQSLCFIGLVKSVNSYDISMNCTFGTYAYTVMKNEILQYFNKIKNINYITHISLSQEINDGLNLEDTLSANEDLEDNVERKLLIDKLYKYIGELTEIEQKVIFNRLNGLSDEKLENIVNLKKARINEIYKKAINKLRYKFLKEGLFNNEY